MKASVLNSRGEIFGFWYTLSLNSSDSGFFNSYLNDLKSSLDFDVPKLLEEFVEYDLCIFVLDLEVVWLVSTPNLYMAFFMELFPRVFL